jgi:translation initiation factor 1A
VSFIVFHNANQGPVEYKLKLPDKSNDEMFALVTVMPGTEYIKVMCEDGIERAARIPGKLRNRVFIKENDVIIIRKREYEENKAEVVWRFLPLQVQKLREKGLLTNLPI